MDGAAPPAAQGGLPAGTIDHCTAVALAIAAVAGWRGGRPVGVSAAAVAAHVRLPEVLGIDMAPPAPRAAPGGGFVHADLGAAGDDDDFERLLTTLPSGVDARGLALAAQEWRLPVCDYRPRQQGAPPAPAAAHPVAIEAGPAAGYRGFRVLDLTAMWGGPLATRLLGQLGAEVIKVEAAARPDGFGAHPALWQALNEGKAVLDIDLRDGDGRAELLRVAETCDLVVDAFSPRVMPNLGLDSCPGGATRVALTAFGPGPERNWVAYGTGVHAVSGLGDTGGPGDAGDTSEGRYRPGPVSYPDPLGGFTAALAGLAAVVGRERGDSPGTMRTSLHAAIAPLVARSAPAWTAPERSAPAAWSASEKPFPDLGVFHPNQNVF